jgi:hypothetical protein
MTLKAERIPLNDRPFPTHEKAKLEEVKSTLFPGMTALKPPIHSASDSGTGFIVGSRNNG